MNGMIERMDGLYQRNVGNLPWQMGERDWKAPIAGVLMSWDTQAREGNASLDFDKLV